MRRFIGLVGVLALCALAAEDDAFLAITIDTSFTKMVGMPEIEMPDLGDLPEGFELPPEALAMFGGGAPTHQMEVKLWSPGDAPAGAEATLTPPAGFQGGAALPLEIQRSGERKERRDPSEREPFNPDDMPDMTIKQYWGSSRTVRDGQPRIIRLRDEVDLDNFDWDAVDDHLAAIEAAQDRADEKGWTSATWPNERAKHPQLTLQDLLPGVWNLATSYTGNATLQVPTNVNILGHFELAGLTEEPDWSQFLDLTWKPIPGLLGSQATMVGSEDENTMVIWSSVETTDYDEPPWDYLSAAAVRAAIQQKLIVPPDTTTLYVPAGIFADSQHTSLMMTGWGQGAANDEGDTKVRLQLKTELMTSFVDPDAF